MTTQEGNSTPEGLVWFTNMAAVLLFSNTNLAPWSHANKVFTDPGFLVDIVGIERSEENRGQKRGEGRISPSVLILLQWYFRFLK